MAGLDQHRSFLADDQEGGVVAVIDDAAETLLEALAEPVDVGGDLARQWILALQRRSRHVGRE